MTHAVPKFLVPILLVMIFVGIIDISSDSKKIDSIQRN